MPDCCPSHQDLLAFHLGTLPDRLVEAVGEHLETCAHCEAALEGLEASADQLLSGLRKSVPVVRRTLPVPGAILPSRITGQPTASFGDDLGPVASPPGYEILDCLGHGGMGVVYRARQHSVGRAVALKRLRPGAAGGRDRFHTEAAALGRLCHPDIVQIHEVIEHEGQIYLALELVEGGSLEQRQDSRPQPAAATAALLERVARAVHYAHSQGIVHRDLKPSNILLSEESGVRSAELRSASPTPHSSLLTPHLTPKITDFGIAKLLEDDAGATREGDLLGTPAYMAPEQAGGQGQPIGPATDVYSLGVILYELLTGRVPLQGPTTLDTLLLVRTAEPVPPRSLQPQVPRDLETVCLKCLEKEPSRRYASAAELADELQRFQSGEPIRARPTSAWERAWKWAKRRPAVAALSAAMVLVAALSFALVFWQWRRAEGKVEDEARAKQAAEQSERQEKAARRQVERLSAGISLTQGVSLCESGEVARGLHWLARALDLAERAGDADLEQAVRCNLSGWRPFLLRRRALLTHHGWVYAVAFSPDGQTALTGSSDHTAQLWDTTSGQPRSEPLRHAHPVWALTFSSDGRTVGTGCGDQADQAGAARLWDAATGRPLTEPLAQPGQVHQVAFSPDGRTFLTACNQQVCLWSVPDGRPLGAPFKHPGPEQAAPGVWPRLRAAFSPDSQTVVTGGADGTVRFWEVLSGRPRGEPLEAPGPVLALAFSPDGRTLLTGSHKGGARLWDVATGRPLGPVLRHRGAVKAVALSPDGEIAATGGVVSESDQDTKVNHVAGVVQLWHTATGRPLGAPLPHPQPVFSLAFSPGGRLLLTGCQDGCARLFLTATGALLARPLAHGGTVTAVAFSRAGLALTACAGGGDRQSARLWELSPEQTFARLLAQPGGDLTHLTFSPDGRLLLTGASDGIAHLWDLELGRRIRPGLPHEGPITAVAFSPDGQTFLTGCEDGPGDGAVRLWDRSGRARGEPLRTGRVCCGGFSPDGGIILAGDAGGRVRCWKAATGESAGSPLEMGAAILALEFSPDGRALLAGTATGTQLWDWDKRQRRGDWREPLSWVSALAFYPDGKRALITTNGVAFVWDVAAGRTVGPPPFYQGGTIFRLALSLDGRRVLASDTDGIARLWDETTGKTLGPAINREGANPVAFGPRGERLAVGGSAGRVAVWEAPRPVAGSAERVRLWIEVFTGLELDDRERFHELDPGTLGKRTQKLREAGGPPG